MEQNVLRFEVTVDDIVAVHVLHCSAHLLYYLLHLLLTPPPHLTTGVEEITVETGF